jgi:hypothetical protein
MISRYFLLLIFTLPFIFAAIINLVTQYKLGKINRTRFIVWILIWVTVLVGLIFTEPLYNWLFVNNLTVSESLSLFDVVQITAIVMLFYIVNRLRQKTEVIERKLRDLHQEISIKLSTKENNEKQ